MQITVGSGNSRQVVQLPNGAAMRKYAKKHPIDYAKAKGMIMSRIRSGGEKDSP